MRFVFPLAAGVAMSGGSGIVRTGAAARYGRRRRDCAGAASLGASASAADVGRVAAATDHRIVLDESLPSVMRWIGLHVTGGQRDDIGRPRVRMERPVLCTVVCRFRRAGRGASRGRPVRRRGLLRPLLVGCPVGPAAGHATRPWGRRLDPLLGKTPRGRLRQGPRARGHPDRGGRSHDRVG